MRRQQQGRTGVIFAGVAVVMFALGTVAASTAGAQPRVLPADSLVYDRTGGLFADLHPPGATRIPVPLTGISRQVQQAIVAVEDRSFWSEGAMDVDNLVTIELVGAPIWRRVGPSSHAPTTWLRSVSSPLTQLTAPPSQPVSPLPSSQPSLISPPLVRSGPILSSAAGVSNACVRKCSVRP